MPLCLQLKDITQYKYDVEKDYNKSHDFKKSKEIECFYNDFIEQLSNEKVYDFNIV